MKMPKIKTITGKGLPAVGGAIGAKFVKNLAKKFIVKPELQKFIPAAPFLLGLFLSEQKGALEYVGIGMMAGGGADLAGGFIPALAGVEDMDLTGIFDSEIDNNLSDVEEDITGSPLNSPIDGADETYGEDY